MARHALRDEAVFISETRLNIEYSVSDPWWRAEFFTFHGHPVPRNTAQRVSAGINAMCVFTSLTQ